MMSEVVNARRVMGAAVDPPRLVAEVAEHPIDMAQAQCASLAPTAGGDKKRRLVATGDLPIALPTVRSERL
jgi:hypothetical protein